MRNKFIGPYISLLPTENCARIPFSLGNCWIIYFHSPPTLFRCAFNNHHQHTQQPKVFFLFAHQLYDQCKFIFRDQNLIKRKSSTSSKRVEWVNEVETRKINQDFFTAASSSTIKSGGEMEKKLLNENRRSFPEFFSLVYSSSDFEKKIQFHYQRGFYW